MINIFFFKFKFNFHLFPSKNFKARTRLLARLLCITVCISGLVLFESSTCTFISCHSTSTRLVVMIAIHLLLQQFPQGAFVAVAKLVVLDLSGTPTRLPPPPALGDMPNLQDLRLR